MSLLLTLPYPPSTNRLWRVWRGVVRKTDEASRYATTVGFLARVAGARPVLGDVVVTMHLYRPRKAGDVDNRAKLILDALQGHAYVNDSQVCELHLYRHEDADKPRAEVEVLLKREDEQ